MNDGAIAPLGKPRSTWIYSIFKGLVEKTGYDFKTPVKKFSDDALEANT